MPVQQHPIPQNIASYQFRLVGDLTLKQFLQITAGVIVAIIFYSLPLPFFFKWPLIAIAAGTGAAIAFLPVQGRPLDQWIVAFIRSIYTPTVYTWQKPNDANSEKINLTPGSQVTTTQPLPAPQPVSSTPRPAPVYPPEVTPSPKPVLSGEIPHPPLTPQVHILTHTQTTPTQEPTLLADNSEDITRHAKTVELPKSSLTSIEKQLRPEPTETQSTSSHGGPVPSNTPTNIQAGTKASFATDLPIPHTPSTPNTIVGMTLSLDGKILDSSIIEILKNGQTIRATKSNKLGQFLFAKPLDDGLYQITADKEGHQFPRFDLNLENKIVPPIRLQAIK